MSADSVIKAANRAGTNPLCPDCGYRTVAYTATRVACPYCGQILVVESRVVRQVAAQFGGKIIVEVDGADR